MSKSTCKNCGEPIWYDHAPNRDRFAVFPSGAWVHENSPGPGDPQICANPHDKQHHFILIDGRALPADSDGRQSTTGRGAKKS